MAENSIRSSASVGSVSSSGMAWLDKVSELAANGIRSSASSSSSAWLDKVSELAAQRALQPLPPFLCAPSSAPLAAKSSNTATRVGPAGVLLPLRSSQTSQHGAEAACCGPAPAAASAACPATDA